MKTGYQLDEDTDMGPMITLSEAERVENWIKEAVEKGATAQTGGKRNGTLVEPTVLTDVPADATVNCEEVFGPVVILQPIDTLDNAIEIANSVDYGLHGAIFTNNVNDAFKAIHGLEVGSVIVNDSTDYRLDQMPFGGVKMSGLGREGIKFALMEMTEPKVVCFNL
jgi:glyceraldehyde-3-phosphate dehydrogenase (NADP+)